MDPLDAFSRPTSNRSFLYFCQMIDFITGPAWAEKVPKDLPVYNIAGGEDPVGQYGEGVKQDAATAMQWFKAAAAAGDEVAAQVLEQFKQ